MDITGSYYGSFPGVGLVDKPPGTYVITAKTVSLDNVNLVPDIAVQTVTLPANGTVVVTVNYTRR
jgi:hypothetical protein